MFSWCKCGTAYKNLLDLVIDRQDDYAICYYSPYFLTNQKDLVSGISLIGGHVSITLEMCCNNTK